MGPRPPRTSLDRINNDGDYGRQNCRWATRREQANNKRSNVRISFDGKTLTVAQWARSLGFSHEALAYRLAHWPLEKAMTTPLPKKRKVETRKAAKKRLSSVAWQIIRRRINARDGWACVICAHRERIVCHHITPVSCGGGDADSNLATLSHSCHRAQESLYGTAAYYWA
jgi:hypothetical protein